MTMAEIHRIGSKNGLKRFATLSENVRFPSFVKFQNSVRQKRFLFLRSNNTTKLECISYNKL